ncbi:MAG TPA: hypothetical protein VMD09_07460 [Solirubrobacteraceae bacterium]|nr:hypothetical protein [Solirubrobacteraceae bacterium]
MDEANARTHIEAHADAVARGDMDAVVADFSEEMRPQVAELAPQLLPLPIAEAEVVSVETEGEEAVARIHYTGESGDEQTLRSTWREFDGRPLIVGVEPDD